MIDITEVVAPYREARQRREAEERRLEERARRRKQLIRRIERWAFVIALVLTAVALTYVYFRDGQLPLRQLFEGMLWGVTLRLRVGGLPPAW